MIIFVEIKLQPQTWTPIGYEIGDGFDQINRSRDNGDGGGYGINGTFYGNGSCFFSPGNYELESYDY